MKSLLIFLLIGLHGLFAKPVIEHLVLTPTREMTRAELYIWKPERNIRAAMIFCPGHSGSGESFVRNEKWQKFADENGLMLCGIYFDGLMSVTEKGEGYSYAARGSGKILLDAINGRFCGTGPPLLLYGYSAGARFATSLLAWKPAKVIAWCASGVGTWPSLPEDTEKISPGIVACGEYDGACYNSSILYFQDGRRRNYPWSFLALEKLGHEYSTQLDDFVIDYFSVLLKAKDPTKIDSAYFDIITKQRLNSKTAGELPLFSGWLPDRDGLVKHWLTIHHP